MSLHVYFVWNGKETSFRSGCTLRTLCVTYRFVPPWRLFPTKFENIRLIARRACTQVCMFDEMRSFAAVHW